MTQHQHNQQPQPIHQSGSSHGHPPPQYGPPPGSNPSTPFYVGGTPQDIDQQNSHYGKPGQYSGNAGGYGSGGPGGPLSGNYGNHQHNQYGAQQPAYHGHSQYDAYKPPSNHFDQGQGVYGQQPPGYGQQYGGSGYGGQGGYGYPPPPSMGSHPGQGPPPSGWR